MPCNTRKRCTSETLAFLVLTNDSREDSPSRYQLAWADSDAPANSRQARVLQTDRLNIETLGQINLC
ncbi:hypothetical protein D3C73_1274880 [compost metagenome]